MHGMVIPHAVRERSVRELVAHLVVLDEHIYRLLTGPIRHPSLSDRRYHFIKSHMGANCSKSMTSSGDLSARNSSPSR